MYFKLLKNIVRYRDIDLDPVEYLVLGDRKLIFIVIGKVACTSIKATIGKSYNIDYRHESGLDVHMHSGWHKEYRKLKDPSSAYFKFAFVRNPLSRLVSCYRDKILFEGASVDYPDYYFKNYYFDIPPNISFASFVERIVKIPDHLADRHFKSQSYSIFRRDKSIKPDFIGRFENLQQDWSVLAKKFGLHPELAHLHSSIQKPNIEKKDFRLYYDMELLDIVHERYKEDFELLGYEDAFKAVVDFVRSK